MGNYRFRLSDMMPNSWFYKLRDMGRSTTRAQAIQHSSSSKRILHHHHPRPTMTTTKQSNQNPYPNPPSSTQQQVYLPNRPSYYFSSRGGDHQTTSPAHPKASDTHFPISPPRKSKREPRKRPIKPSSPATPPLSSSVPNSCSSALATDIIFDVIKSQSPVKDFDVPLSARPLPPILTKPAKKEAAGRAVPASKHVRPHRIKVRPSSSPKIEVRRVQAARNRKMANSMRLGESFVVVKKSADPRRDFRESMVEMIVENDIRASKDLEELLARYLSLNSDEYHGLIVKVFEEIWVDLTEVLE